MPKVGVQKKRYKGGFGHTEGMVVYKEEAQVFYPLWFTLNSYLKQAYKNSIVYFNKTELFLSKSIQKIFSNDE